MRRKLFILFRGIVSVFLLFYLLSMIEWNHVWLLLSKTKKEILFFAPVLLMIGLLFAAIRWHHLLANIKIRRKIKRLYAYYLMGAFYSIFLPGVIGGDIVRIGICASETKRSISIITTTVLIERVCGVIILFVMGSFVVFCIRPELFSALGDPITKILPAFTAVGVILLAVTFLTMRRFSEKSLPEEKKKRFLKKILLTIHPAIILPYSTLFAVFFFSALFQAADILSSFAIAKALNISAPLPFFFAIMPIVYICTILPVSLGGLGVREGTLVYFLAKIGISISDAVALSFLIYFNRIAIGSIGGMIQVLWKTKVANKPTIDGN